MMLRKRRFVWVLAAAVMFTSAAASAGFKLTSIPVQVATGSARGAVGAARNNATGTDYIGCTVQALHIGGTTQLTGQCFAQNASRSAACTTSDPLMITAIMEAGDDGNLILNWDATTGVCFLISVDRWSALPPKVL